MAFNFFLAWLHTPSIVFEWAPVKRSKKFSEWLTITWMPPRLFRLKYGENLSEIIVVQSSTNWCTRPATKVSLVLLGTRNASARPVPLSNMPQTHVPRLLHPRLYLHLWPNIDSLIKAGFHMIADNRGSQIADRRKFCDRLRSYENTLLRSPAILRSWSQTIAEDRTMFYLLRSSAIICDRLRSCDHMETKVLWSAIEMYPIIFLILTDDSMFLSHKARMFDYSNAHLL